jgi:hypothetical protein
MENFNPFHLNLESVNITRLDEVSIKKEFEDGTFIVETDILPEVQYKTERALEYPSIGEQLDMMWHAMDEDETKRIEPFYSSIKEIKDKYPKAQ